MHSFSGFHIIMHQVYNAFFEHARVFIFHAQNPENGGYFRGGIGGICPFCAISANSAVFFAKPHTAFPFSYAAPVPKAGIDADPPRFERRNPE
jgi:hypothetical protein